MKIKKTISSLFKREILTQVQDDVLLPKARRPKRSAFTLAEVLITLGIIGVVAAITIPTLVAEYQNRSWNTASTVFQRKLGEALQVMNVQQTLTGWQSTEDFVTELQKHLKIVNVCDKDHLQNCFTDTVIINNDEEFDMSKVKTAKNFGKEWEHNTNIVGFQTADGVNALVAYNPDCESNPYATSGDGGSAITISGSGKNVTLGVKESCLAVLYDVQGFSKPNKEGKDIRNVGDVTLKEGSTCVEGVFCYTKVLAPGDYEPVDCTDPSADGYEYCGDFNVNPNYWAGAMKACKGKLPDGNDLIKMANYIYDIDLASTPNLSKMVDSGNSSIYISKMSEFGLIYDNYFIPVWGSDTGGMNNYPDVLELVHMAVDIMHYDPSSFNYSYAICLE